MSSVHILSKQYQMIIGLKQNKYVIYISSVYIRFKFNYQAKVSRNGIGMH